MREEGRKKGTERGRETVARYLWCYRARLAITCIFANISRIRECRYSRILSGGIGTTAPCSLLRMEMSILHSYSHLKTNLQIRDCRDSGSGPIESRTLFIRATKSF